MGKTFLIFVFLLLPRISEESAQVKHSFDFTEKIVDAHRHIMALRLEKGTGILKSISQTDPENPCVAFVEDYAHFLQSFINEREDTHDKEKVLREKRLQILRKADKTSPYYRFCQAEVLIHSAIINFKFKEYLSGANEMREAYNLLQDNIRQFPAFKPHYKSIGILEVMVGTIPSKYRWVTSILGMKGDIDSGINKVEKFINDKNLTPEEKVLHEEAVFLYSFLQLHILKDKVKAWAEVKRHTTDYRQNLLKTYLRASIGMQCKKNNEVITTLENRPSGPEYIDFYFMDYMLGNAKLQRMDKDADIPYKRFVTYFKGVNYIKDAYLKLAWHSLIFKTPRDYNNYLIMVKTFGNTNIDEDKQALKEAEDAGTPIPEMVKGRLLFDGGYYERAIVELEKVNESELQTKRRKVEWKYRKARVYDESGKEDMAIKLYKETIDAGKTEAWYFAAYSCVQMGLIYENRRQFEQARQYFTTAISLPNEEYQNSIEQKARAGLKRIEGK